eukprot:5671364-Pyramimonas_sp.AAC.1
MHVLAMRRTRFITAGNTGIAIRIITTHMRVTFAIATSLAITLLGRGTIKLPPITPVTTRPIAFMPSRLLRVGNAGGLPAPRKRTITIFAANPRIGHVYPTAGTTAANKIALIRMAPHGKKRRPASG